jgi:hypothetical protein
MSTDMERRPAAGGPQITTEKFRMHAVESTNVEALGFRLDSAAAKTLALTAAYGAESDELTAEEATGTMRIRFAGGRTYEYENVPAFVYALIANAPSVGSVVQLLKRGRFMEDYHQV